jgi:hypothetical protein
VVLTHQQLSDKIQDKGEKEERGTKDNSNTRTFPTVIAPILEASGGRLSSKNGFMQALSREGHCRCTARIESPCKRSFMFVRKFLWPLARGRKHTVAPCC